MIEAFVSLMTSPTALAGAVLRPTDDEHGNLHSNAVRRYPGLRPAVEEKPLPLPRGSLLIPSDASTEKIPPFPGPYEFLRQNKQPPGALMESRAR